jgi:hypothetical protein
MSTTNANAISGIVAGVEGFTVAVNWAFAFADRNHTATRTPMLASHGPPVYLVQVSAVNTGSVSVDVAASGPRATHHPLHGSSRLGSIRTWPLGLDN